jgi:CubicO group peptidase (beta-lactamase class C family)
MSTDLTTGLITPPVSGFVAAGFEPVKAAFAANWNKEGVFEVGAGLAMYHCGELVVDLQGGWTDKSQQHEYNADTLQLVFSTTKGVVAIAVAMCVQRGLLSYSEPVGKYWPEFAENGKGNITVAQMMSHQAGLIDAGDGVTMAQALDASWIASRLASGTPEWEPGSKHGYHALTYGWLAGEVVRRVDPAHRTVGTFIAEEIVAPLGVEMWVGLPEEIEPRVSPILVPPPMDPAIAEMMLAFIGPQTTGGRALSLRGAFELAGEDSSFNRRDVHAAEVPAANGITNAKSLARIYAATMGEINGVRLLDDATRDAARVTVTPDGEADACLIVNTTFGMGFMTYGVTTPFAGPGSFGHNGAGGSLAFASPENEMSVSYVMNQMNNNLGLDARPTAIIDVALECIKHL